MNKIEIIKNILPQAFMLQKDVINLIPDVKPRNTADLLDDLIFASITNEMEFKHLGDIPSPIANFALTEDEIDACRLSFHENGKERTVLTTIGANLLIRLFKAGHVEQKKKTSSKDISKLEAYSNSLSSIRKSSDLMKLQIEEDRKSKQHAIDQRKARIDYLLKHPEKALPSDLNRRFLNEYAYAIGPGSRTFKLGEAEVVKTVQKLKSNSGKTTNTHVSIYWITTDGARHGDEDFAPYLNRRNDPNRNWGLGRE